MNDVHVHHHGAADVDSVLLSEKIGINIDVPVNGSGYALPYVEKMEVTISQDAGWSKRGKAMNSLSGWGHVIGHETKRCLDYSTRIKGCKKCSTYSCLGQIAPAHDCRKNWEKSSKAMEADIAVELHQNASNSGLVYTKIIGDEDSSSIYHIRNKVNPDVEKYSDLSHIKRSISRRLDGLQKQHKELTDMVKTDFIKNFAYAVRQNSSDPEENMTRALRAVVEHMFGNHEDCGQWCRYGKVKDYQHSGLPYGKDLKSNSLRNDLHVLLHPFVENRKRFLTGGSTQSNESLNSVAWSKAPKFRNYNMSESFDFRCASGVLQFNEGVSYVNKLCNKYLSPRKETQKYCSKLDKRRSYHKNYVQSRKQKKQRIQLKKDRKRRDKTSEIKQGVTYMTDILNEKNIDLTDITDQNQTTKLSLPMDNVYPIYLDLGTTKLGYDAEITQIAAYSGTNLHSQYIIPNGQISPEATKITGLQVECSGGNKTLTLHGNPVEAVKPESGLHNFVNWILRQKKPNILIAHNGDKFDFPILYRHLQKFDLLDKLSSNVFGTVDSLPPFKQNIQSTNGHSLLVLYKTVCNGPVVNLHNAEDDVKALREICETDEDRSILKILLKNIIGIESSITLCIQNIAQLCEINTLKTKLSDKKKCVISDRIAKKLCTSGVTYDMLKLVHNRDKEEGVFLLLSEKINGVTRVTNRKCIINAIKSFLDNCDHQ